MKHKLNKLIKNMPLPFFLILVIVLFIITFSFINRPSENKHKTTSDKLHSTKNIHREHIRESRKTKGLFPFDVIRTNSQRRKRSVDLKVIPKTLKQIPKAFFQTWIAYIPVTGMEQKFVFQPASQAEYYFYDFAETNDLFLFSIVIRNVDAAQNELIHFTCDKANGRISHAELVAVYGGEGGYSNHSRIEYSANRLTITVISEVSQPIDRHWETRRFVTQYTIEPERTTMKQLQ